MSEVLTRPPMAVDALIENYVRLRDKKKTIEDRHKEELAPFKQTMEQIEGWLLEALNQAQVDSMKGRHGTAYKTLRTSAVVRDWTATLAFIRDNGLWDLLEARVSKLAAQAIIEETNKPIPGVETSSEVVVNVRRAGEKSAAGK
jgi:hypothetical protein